MFRHFPCPEPDGSIHNHPSTAIHLQPHIHSHPSTATHPQPSIHSHPSTSTHPQPSIYIHTSTAIHLQPHIHSHPSTATHPQPSIHSHPSCFLKIIFNIILVLNTRSSEQFPHQNSVYISLLLLTCYSKFLITGFYTAVCYFLPSFLPSFFPSSPAPCSRTPPACVLHLLLPTKIRTRIKSQAQLICLPSNRCVSLLVSRC